MTKKQSRKGTVREQRITWLKRHGGQWSRGANEKAVRWPINEMVLGNLYGALCIRNLYEQQSV